MENEMIERVARAICEAHGDREGCARAAIAAMRAPTQAMLKPGWNLCNDAEEIWQSMIDVALKSE